MLSEEEILNKIKKVVDAATSEYTFGINLGMDTHFTDVDSVSAIVFVINCEDEFGIKFRDDLKIISNIMRTDSNYTIGGFVQDVKGEIASKKTGILQNLHSAVTRRCK